MLDPRVVNCVINTDSDVVRKQAAGFVCQRDNKLLDFSVHTHTVVCRTVVMLSTAMDRFSEVFVSNTLDLDFQLRHTQTLTEDSQIMCMLFAGPQVMPHHKGEKTNNGDISALRQHCTHPCPRIL